MAAADSPTNPVTEVLLDPVVAGALIVVGVVLLVAWRRRSKKNREMIESWEPIYGEIVRKPMSGKDAAIVGAVYFDKRQILNNQPTTINGTNVDSRLAEFMNKFEELGCAMSAARTIEGEVVENDTTANCLTADQGDS